MKTALKIDCEGVALSLLMVHTPPQFPYRRLSGRDPLDPAEEIEGHLLALA
jgi:hypothetical protein